MVLFDLVGTILAPAVPVEATYAATALRHGLRIDPKIVATQFRQALWRYRYRPQATVPSDGDDRFYWGEIIRESLAPVFGSGLGPERWEAMVEELYEQYGRGAAWRLYPETRRVLADLRDLGLRLGVLSNWDRRARRVLADLGLIEFFSAIFLSAELGAAKPDPRLYRLVAERLGYPPGALLLVGDDPENDGTAPRACGYAIWVVRRPEGDLERLPLRLAKAAHG
ncbi:HAD-IA family hydrolase [Verrucomicrobium sp. 3C]|uniref:HAD-IA family hydrolase n=1 Tax=Verrucomicrobium sp. 3C TaxID=1134055 RepID=UPI000379ABEA|nr:HAD-IA family hydrolase [Verrucomicrobium sp. 3C]